jgi:hypothetical protein
MLTALCCWCDRLPKEAASERTCRSTQVTRNWSVYNLLNAPILFFDMNGITLQRHPLTSSNKMGNSQTVWAHLAIKVIAELTANFCYLRGLPSEYKG